MNSINLNYLRGLYDFLLGKSDEELEGFDINLPANQRLLFDEMRLSFLKFGPIAKKNTIDGVNFILNGLPDDFLWRSAIPHDLPLNRVMDKRGYLEGILFALTEGVPISMDVKDFVLIDEIGPDGLDFFK